MALDSENKRRSVQAYWVGLARPVPDGTIDASDRATSAWFYSGLTYASPILGVGARITKFTFRMGFRM